MSLPLLSRVCCRYASTNARNLKRKAMLDRMIRVDHAGELGADRIYAGQMAVLGKTAVGPVIKEMQEQEKEHLARFNQLMRDHRGRPTVLLPIWHVAGFALGAGSALLGKEGAMACTVAVEDVIGDHYNSIIRLKAVEDAVRSFDNNISMSRSDCQIRELMEDDPDQHRELLQTITKFRDEELHHQETGFEHDAEKAPFYTVLTQVIKVGCRGAIWISERI